MFAGYTYSESILLWNLIWVPFETHKNFFLLRLFYFDLSRLIDDYLISSDTDDGINFVNIFPKSANQARFLRWRLCLREVLTFREAG